MWQYVLIDRGNESGKSLLVLVKYTGASPMKSLPNISAYDSLKDFTPDLIFRCSLPKAMSISRSEIFRKKRGGPEVEKLPSVKVLESPKAMSVSRSEIFRKKEKKRRTRSSKIALGKDY